MGIQLGSRAFDPRLRSCVRQGGVLAGPVDRRGAQVQGGYRGPRQARRRDAAAAIPADPVPHFSSQPAVSAGQLAQIARLPGTGPVLARELPAWLPGGVLACTGDGSPFR